MWTRGLRTRSSLSWMLLLAMKNRLPFTSRLRKALPPRPRPLSPEGRGGKEGRRSFLRGLRLRLGPDAHLLEQALARPLVRNQLHHQLRQRQPAPAHHLFQGEGQDGLRLG